MVRAVECLVEDVVEDRGGVLVPVLSNHQNSPVVHTRQLRRDTDFGLEPTLRDPYESNMVEIGGSNIDGANEGLFARQDIEINTVIAFYNGSKARPEEYEPDTWETNNYKIFDPDDMPDGTIDIPVWAQVNISYLYHISIISPSYLYHISILYLSHQASSAYCATLAHKTNHSFLPNCQFLVFDHPKFGLVPCISTIADINKGDEVRRNSRVFISIFLISLSFHRHQVLVSYGYEWVEAPEWYKQAWSKSKYRVNANKFSNFSYKVGFVFLKEILILYSYNQVDCVE